MNHVASTHGLPPNLSLNLTKILCTIGPATSTPESVVALINAGASTFRINFSHGTEGDHMASLTAIRKAEEITGKHVGVLGDLCGPKLRVGKVQSPGVMIEPGQQVVLHKENTVTDANIKPGDPVAFSCNTPAILDDVRPGERVFINDGEIKLHVVSCEHQTTEACRVTLRVDVGGLVTSGKGINLPDSKLKLPAITQHDVTCARWALANNLNYLALSFVRTSLDVRELRALLIEIDPTLGAKIPIISKIEKPQAVDEIESILGVTDGIMVARGDLGVEMDLAQVPVIQKRLITLAHEHGRHVIVATQMLQTMIDAPVPTRAEVSDVANAIYDGADALMLSGETAVGKYPAGAVDMMNRIGLHTQKHLSETTLLGNLIDPGAIGSRPNFKRQKHLTRYRTAAMAHAVITLVSDLDARLVITWSEEGGGARFLSLNRLKVPILAFSSSQRALRRMSLFFGVVPCYLERPASTEEFLAAIDRFVLTSNHALAGDAVIVIKGDPIGAVGVSNEIRVHYVGDVCRVPGVNA